MLADTWSGGVASTGLREADPPRPTAASPRPSSGTPFGSVAASPEVQETLHQRGPQIGHEAFRERYIDFLPLCAKKARTRGWPHLLEFKEAPGSSLDL